MDLRKLYDYNIWANNKMFQHLRTLPEDILHREVPSSFPTIGATLAHIYVSDVIDLSTMKKVPDIDERQSEWEAKTKNASIDALEDCFKVIKEQYEDFLSRDLDFDAIVSEDDMLVSYSDIFQHVVNHSTYHRGNITSMLRQLGYTGVSTDILTYVFSSGLENQATS